MNRYNDLLKEITENKVVPTHKDEKVLIIDGLNNFLRCFSAISTLNDEGEPVGGLTGFLLSLGAAIRLHNPTRCIIVFDGEGGSQRRRKVYSGYKEGRMFKSKLNRQLVSEGIDEQASLRQQYMKLHEYLDLLPVTVIVEPKIEADDTIGYIAKQILNDEVVIMSSDKDFLQLVNDKINVWSPTKKKLYTPELIEQEYGLPSQNFIWYRVFDGDKSDNIPGIKGAGLKSIKKYLPFMLEDKQIDIDTIYEFIDSCDSKYKIYEQLKDNKDIVERNYKLMQLLDVDISGTTKLSIADKVGNSITPMNTFNFKTMFIQDKLYGNIKNIDYWISNTFRVLNKFALQEDKG